MFDKKKTGYVKVEDIRAFVEMLHDGDMHSNAETGVQSLYALSDAQGTVNYHKLQILHRNFPHLLYPAFR
jgi:Ca2+-binding EF-hand superfamily protein